jgi:hypothetical protein
VYLRFGAGVDLRLPPTHVVDDSDPGYVTELQLPCAGVTVVQSSSNARLS